MILCHPRLVPAAKSYALLLAALSGCYYLGQNSYRDVIKHPSSDWSSPECLTVILGAARHNLSDIRSETKVIATPYYPTVVKAIGRRAQVQYHWDETNFRGYVDRLVNESCGMYVDWEKPGEIVYSRNMSRVDRATQFDSLIFLITFQVRGWKSEELRIQVPVPDEEGTMDQLIPLDEYPAGESRATDMKEGTILLENERGETLAPKLVWGKRMAYLTTNQESMFAKFNLNSNYRHFLDGSERYFLTVKGYEHDIRLVFSTDEMR